MTKIYLDNAATTPVEESLIGQLTDLLKNQYVNADSLYEDAVAVKRQLEAARSTIAKQLKVKDREIIFTSGASEGNNQIIRGVIDFFAGKNRQLITTDIEHSSVKQVFDYYESLGYPVVRIKVNKDGIFDMDQLRSVLAKDALLVAVMGVNNETGTILPIKEIAEYVKTNSRAYVFSDLTQALGKVPFSLENLDFASFSAHKFGGFKGSGFIYKKESANLRPLIMGGQQEFDLRAGTSNTPYQILLAKAIAMVLAHDNKNIRQLNDYLKERLGEIEGITINSKNSSPFILNFSITGLTSQVAINALSQRGIMVSGQSTCSSQKYEYSRVLTSMGFDSETARNTLRVSFWHQNTQAEVDCFIDNLKEVINDYRL